MGSVATLIVLKKHVTDTSTKIKLSHMSRDVLLQYTLRMLTRGQHQRTTPPIFIFLSFQNRLPGGGNSPGKCRVHWWRVLIYGTWGVQVLCLAPKHMMPGEGWLVGGRETNAGRRPSLQHAPLTQTAERPPV